MSSRANVNLYILWEDELRTASRLLDVANALHKGDPDVPDAVSAAWAACSVALCGIGDEVITMVASDTLRKVGRDCDAKT